MTRRHDRARLVRAFVCAAALAMTPGAATAGPGTISGKTFNPSGTARNGVIVTALGQQHWARTTSGPGGAYALANLEYDTYRIFFDPNPRANHLAFQWSGGADEPGGAAGLVVSASTPTLANVNVTLRTDADGDGLSDTFEPTWCDAALQLCIDQTKRDTDGDTLADGDEINLTATNPLRVDSSSFLGTYFPNGINDDAEDPDGDLLSNAEELNDPAWSKRTDPRAADVDQDALTDFEEVRSMAGVVSPFDPDTDGDGLLDGADDRDNDALTNRKEIDLRLNPRQRDSDSDGVFDASEDADLDGLTTAQEITSCNIFVGCANPYDPDTDNDGLPDGIDPQPVVAPPMAEDPAGPLGLQPVPAAPSTTVNIGANQTAVIDPATVFGIDETATSSLALQVTVQAPTVTGYLTVLPSGAAPNPGVTSIWFNAGEQQMKYTIVKLGSAGNVAVTNVSGSAQNVTVQLLARFGRDLGSGHDRYRPALATAMLDTGVWTGSPTAIDLHPEIAIPADPTGGGDDLTDVERAVLLITHLPPAGATTAPFAVDVAPGSSGTPAVSDSVSGAENGFQQRIISVKLDHSGGPLAQLVHRQGRAWLRVALLGYYVADQYFEAAPAATDPVIALTAGTTVNYDLRGIDGSTTATFALMSVTASNATSAGTIRFSGNAQVAVRAGATTTNTVLAPVNASGAITAAFDAPAGQTVQLSYDLQGWFEHVTYPGPPFVAPAASARYTALAAPVQVYENLVANSETRVTVTNANGVPARGVSQVVVAAQTWSGFGIPSAPSDLWLWGTGRKRAATPQLHAAPGRADTAILVVDVGSDGRISFQASGVPLYAELSVIGWLTPYTGSGSAVVAMIGDSITVAAGTYNHLLGSAAMQINTYGLSGHTTHDLRPWAAQMGYTNPSDAIVFLGTNDLFQTLVGFDIGHDPIDELRRYSTDHFPASTCVTYVANPYADQIRALVAEAPTRRNVIDLDVFLAANHQTRVTPRFPSTNTYLKNVLQQYGMMASDGIHLSATGSEALVMLYQRLALGATPGIGKTAFAATVAFPNAVVPNFASYVHRTCP